jgi:hypothetical protein
MASLRDSSGGQSPLTAGRPTRIGRSSDNDIVIADSSVSRHHATITIQGGSYLLYDLDCYNGTFLDGRRIQTAKLTHGSRIRFGNIDWSFENQVPPRKLAAKAPRRWPRVLAVGAALAIIALGVAFYYESIYLPRHRAVIETRSQTQSQLAARVAEPEQVTTGQRPAKGISTLGRVVVSPSFGAVEQAAAGLYVLDQAITFNVLDAVSINPQTGALTLVGHRDSRYGNAQIPYFDLLATFLDYPRPRFNLMPTPDSVRMSRKFFKGEYGDRILNAFGQLYSSGEANQDARLLLGLSSPNPNQSELTQAVLNLTGDEQKARDLESTQPDLLRAALLAAWLDPDGMQIGPAAMDSAFNLKFRVRPEYLDLDPASALARVMLDSDYLGKSLKNNRALEAKILGFQTKFAFERSKPHEPNRVRGERLWFWIGHVDLAESNNRNTLEIQGVSMRVGMRQFDDSLRGVQLDSPDEKVLPYEARLTALYDQFARQYPVLHELKECAKLAAVARWLRTRDPRVRLPKAGRVKLRQPDVLLGLFYAYLSIPSGRGPTGPPKSGQTSFHTVLDVEEVAEGGVSLDPFPGESGLPDIHTDPVVLDLNKTSIATPPEGLPTNGTIAGWVKNLPDQYQVAQMPRGVFGEQEAKPGLVPINNPATGSDIRALDQVRSGCIGGKAATAAALIEGMKGQGSWAFDTGGPAAGGDSPCGTEVPSQSGSPDQRIPAAVLNNPGFQALVSRMKELDRKDAQIEDQIKQQEQVVASAPPEQKGNEELKLSELYRSKSNNGSQKSFTKVKGLTTFNVDVTVVTSSPGSPAPASAATGSSAPPPAQPSGIAPPPG